MENHNRNEVDISRGASTALMITEHTEGELRECNSREGCDTLYFDFAMVDRITTLGIRYWIKSVSSSSVLVARLFILMDKVVGLFMKSPSSCCTYYLFVALPQ